MHCMLHDAAREQGASNDLGRPTMVLYTELLRSICSGSRESLGHLQPNMNSFFRTTGKRLTLLVNRLALRMPCAIHFPQTDVGSRNARPSFAANTLNTRSHP